MLILVRRRGRGRTRRGEAGGGGNHVETKSQFTNDRGQQEPKVIVKRSNCELQLEVRFEARNTFNEVSDNMPDRRHFVPDHYCVIEYTCT